MDGTTELIPTWMMHGKYGRGLLMLFDLAFSGTFYRDAEPKVESGLVEVLQKLCTKKSEFLAKVVCFHLKKPTGLPGQITR